MTDECGMNVSSVDYKKRGNKLSDTPSHDNNIINKRGLAVITSDEKQSDRETRWFLLL